MTWSQAASAGQATTSLAPTLPGIGVWLQAARAKSLFISSIAVLSAGALAYWHGHLNGGILLAWLGAVAVQAGTNLTNVYHNYKAAEQSRPGALLDPQGSSAPVRTGQLTAAQVRLGYLACFATAVATGVALTAVYGWRILAMGIPGLAAGYFYAAPPLRLAYRALGVVTVFLFLGPVMVTGSYWVVTGHTNASVYVLALVIGLLAAGIMHINDVRDVEGDLANGKRTLTTLIGRENASWALAGMTGGAFLLLTSAVVMGLLPWPVLAAWFAAPRAVEQARVVFLERDPMTLNRAWFLGVRLMTEAGALMIAGLAVASALGR